MACNEFSFQISTYPSRLRSRTQVKQLEAFPVDSRTARLHGERAPCTNTSGEFLCRKEHMVHCFFCLVKTWKFQKQWNFSNISMFGKDTKKDLESVCFLLLVVLLLVIVNLLPGITGILCIRDCALHFSWWISAQSTVFRFCNLLRKRQIGVWSLGVAFGAQFANEKRYHHTYMRL